MPHTTAGETEHNTANNRQKSAVVTILIMSLLLLVLFIVGLYKKNPAPQSTINIAMVPFVDDFAPTTSNNTTPKTNNSSAAPATTIPTQQFEEAAIMPASPATVSMVAPTPALGSTFLGFSIIPSNGNPLTGLQPSNIVGASNNDGPNSHNGLSGKLEGRATLHRELPATEKQVYGTVRVRVTVNAAGKVVSAVYDASNSTTTDLDLKQLSITAALKWQWSADPKNRPEQVGYIDFEYAPQ